MVKSTMHDVQVVQCVYRKRVLPSHTVLSGSSSITHDTKSSACCGGIWLDKYEYAFANFIVQTPVRCHGMMPRSATESQTRPANYAHQQKSAALRELQLPYSSTTSAVSGALTAFRWLARILCCRAAQGRHIRGNYRSARGPTQRQSAVFRVMRLPYC